MSYNQKPPGPSGSSGTGIGGSAPNGPNNQTPQQVAKTLAGIQQQMQSLVHGQNALPQSTPADLNAFFQQQRFQTMIKQQQQQLLQQHFQQQMQQQQHSKERIGSSSGGGGGEPLALTRTQAAAELLNKTYQQHHQQANGSSAPNPTLASVNQQIQQQLQAFPPNIMQQLQAFQYQMQQQQQHPQQQQHHTQGPLQQTHQQAQSSQLQPQHQGVQQQLHGQTHQQQQKALTTAAAAHMQQLQQSLQQKYLSAAAAANQPAVSGNKMSATPPPPPLTNQVKAANLPPSTQMTPVPPVTIGVGLAASTSSSVNSVLATISSLPTPSASKQVPPSISLVPAKQPAVSPTFSGSHPQNKFVTGTTAGTVSSKSSPIVSAIPAPYPSHYQKPSAVASAVASVGSSSPLSPAKTSLASDTIAPKQPQTILISKQQQQSQQQPQPQQQSLTQVVTTASNNQVSKIQEQQTNSIAPTINSSQGPPQKPTQTPTHQQMQQQKSEKDNKTTSIATTHPITIDPKPSGDPIIVDVALEKIKQAECATKAHPTVGINTLQSQTECSEIPKEGPKSTDSLEAKTTTIEISCKTEVQPDKEAKDETKEKNIKCIETKVEDASAEKLVQEANESVENTNKDKQENISSATSNEKKGGDKSLPVASEKKSSPEKLIEAVKKLPTVSEDKLELTNIAESQSTKNGSPDDNKTLKSSVDHKIIAKAKDTEKSDKGVEKKIDKEQNSIVDKADKSIDVSKEKTEKSAQKEEKQSTLTVSDETPLENKVKKTKSENVNAKEKESTPIDGAVTKNITKSTETASLTETPVRKHGRQARTPKPTHVVTVTSKPESYQTKRGTRDERKNSKIKSEVNVSSPSSTPTDATLQPSDRKSQRHRLKTILYQSPLPELAYITKLSASEASNSPKPMSVEDKLIVFYKNEYMAVRNAEGTFYLCQTMQNVYRTSPRISIRWLSEDKKDSSIFIPDFYDHTDIECVLTTVELKRIEKGQLRLPKAEKLRIESILKKAIDVEKGLLPRPDITEENPDGLDISLYKDESQIDKRASAGSTPSSSGRKSRRVGNAAKCTTPSTEKKRKRGSSIEGAKKTQNKKRKTIMKKKKSSKNNSSDEDVTSDEESDTEYKPNQKKATTSSASKSSPRAQRSPLAKARAASPITSTSSKSKTPVPQTSSTNPLTTNNRIQRANKRKTGLENPNEGSTSTPAKKLVAATKVSISKSKAQESPAEVTNKKSNEISSNSVDNSLSTSVVATSLGGSRPTRNRK